MKCRAGEEFFFLAELSVGKDVFSSVELVPVCFLDCFAEIVQEVGWSKSLRFVSGCTRDVSADFLLELSMRRLLLMVFVACFVVASAGWGCTASRFRSSRHKWHQYEGDPIGRLTKLPHTRQ